MLECSSSRNRSVFRTIRITNSFKVIVFDFIIFGLTYFLLSLYNDISYLCLWHSRNNLVWYTTWSNVFHNRFSVCCWLFSSYLYAKEIIKYIYMPQKWTTYVPWCHVIKHKLSSSYLNITQITRNKVLIKLFKYHSNKYLLKCMSRKIGWEANYKWLTTALKHIFPW